jgi:subtilisin-like proprotein convertase family protein
MRVRVVKWSVLCLLILAGGVLWHWQTQQAKKSAAAHQFSFTKQRPSLPGQTPALNTLPAQTKAALATNQFALRLSNTPKSLAELMNNGHAILLENALVDTERPLDFSIPKHLRSQKDPGAYIVQSRGSSGAAFRALLARAGAQVVSYIPNNAYLVRVSVGGAGALAGDPLTQSVMPYEPYYKIQSSLLRAAIGQQPLPDGAVLNLGIFADGSAQTISQIENLGGKVLAQDRSPFGPLLRVAPPQNWTALAALPGVQIVEPFHRRVAANDLSRVETGVSVDTLVTSNYMGLTGSNVMVEVNDSGIDATHPDFTTGGTPSTGAGSPPVRVFALTANELVDTDGHGTFVAGEIAGNGAASWGNVAPGGPNVGGVLQSNSFGSVLNADFRGKAPLANLFAMNFNDSDLNLQEQAALTNAPISNNSWNFDGDNAYDLEAASYDAATRDSLPFAIGSQPVLYVFSAGNSGGGDDLNDPGGGSADSVESPATAKDVISVGSIQLLRNITNSVTNPDGTMGQPWLPETSTSYRAAGFSSRGNVGIGTEGPFGRFKPDVTMPGTFIVSTRSAQWDTNAYFYQNPINYDTQTFPGIVLPADSPFFNGFPLVPTNAISVSVLVSPNASSPSPFPTLPISVGLIGSPFTGAPITPQAVPNLVTIPTDGNYTIGDILSSETFYGFNYSISNNTPNQITFDLSTTIVTVNTVGNEQTVLSNLDNTIGPFYRFESGTSMSAASVSGVLALMQDFFQNHSTLPSPSPALLKALLINGARPTGAYDLQVDNNINFIGWGLVNLPNSLPPTIQTNFSGGTLTPSSIFIQDQSPTNALATGDRHAFQLNVQSNSVPLRVTLAWTDPPGNPSAAVKLVNSLELVVSNFDDPANPIMYYGNDIPAGGIFNNANPATNPFVADSINNVQNVIIPATLGTNYAVIVIGRAVNVNAVSAQTNNAAGQFAPNVVQDYALVVSSGDGGAMGSFTVTNLGVTVNPTAGQDVTFVASTNTPLLHQTVGANPSLLGTNTVNVGTNTQWASSGEVTLGMTNQWHFYVVTNHATDASGVAADVTNAAFAVFQPPTLSIPRMGVFAGSPANSTRVEADIDLYVSTDPTLLVLNPTVISNCLNGGQINMSSPAGVNGVFYGSSLTRGGAEFVVDSNSTPGQVYYVGVKSEDQMASEYSFVPIFTSVPFSSQDQNGDQHVYGAPVPVDIPDGTTEHPGINYVFGFALYPVNIANITATNVFTHENFGDLYGTLTHEGATGPTKSVLNNHNGLGTINNYQIVYDDAYNFVTQPTVNTNTPTDPPGNLQTFYGQDGSGMWILTELDDANTQTGSVRNFGMFIKMRHPLTNGSSDTNTVGPQQWFYDFVDVPPGATNLTINVTNLNGAPINALLVEPLFVFVQLGVQPTTNNFDKAMVIPIAPPPPGNSMSIGPADVPPLEPERYWIGVFNPNPDPQTFKVSVATLPANPTSPLTDFAITGNSPLTDDAVSVSNTIDIASTESIVSVNVGIRVDHPRISDLVFHLIAPDGTRYLLMENRGGDTTNGAGATYVITNTVSVSAGGNGRPSTNYINAQEISGTVPIVYNFYTAPDEMTIYYGTNVIPSMKILDTGFTNNPPLGGGGAQNTSPETLTVTFGPTNGVVSTYLTVIMNQFGNPRGPNGTAWTYTFGGVVTNFAYLTFTEDTNLTTTPIKYAVPPFVPTVLVASNVQVDSFEAYADAGYAQGSTFGSWTVLTNTVFITNNPLPYDGTNMLALKDGAVVTTLPTIAGQKYLLQYAQGADPLTGLFSANQHNFVPINTIAIEQFDLAANGTAYDSTLGSPIALAFNSSGDLYASDSSDNSIEVFPRGGQKSVYIPAGNPYFTFAAAMTFDSLGNLYVADLFSSTLYQFTPPNTTGTLLATAANNLNGPAALAFDGSGNLFIGNNFDNTIWKFAPPYTGGVLFTNIGEPDSQGLESLAFDPSGNLFAGDYNAGVIWKITPNGATNFFVTIPNVAALAFDSNTNLYAADRDDSVIYQISPGGVVSIFSSSSDLDFPRALAFFTSNTDNPTNANWQLTSQTFTASQANQPLVLDGSGGAFVNGSGSVITNVFGNNALFDDFTLTELPTDLYYLPEQSLSTIAGTSALGEWQLEIQDTRAGGFDSNNPPVLVSWELQFVLANTNSVPFVLSGGVGQTNQFLPPNDIAWYSITVPANANFATNLLLFATDPSGAPAPLNVWFDTNSPSTTNILLLNGQSSGTVLLSTTNPPDSNVQPPPNIVDGETYYLGVQNLNNFTVNYGIKVNFDVAGQFSNMHLSSKATSGVGNTLHWTGQPGAKFRVQWTDSLDSPVHWNMVANLVTSNTGQFSFTDDGSQTAPLGRQRYYRVVQISP